MSEYLEHLKVSEGVLVECTTAASRRYTVGARYTVIQNHGRLCIRDNHDVCAYMTGSKFKIVDQKCESSGGSCEYYRVGVKNPTTPSQPQYTAECNDVIESLKMTYAEANMFKEIWRQAAARTLGKEKEGNTTKRGAEKIVFFADRNMVQVCAM